MGCTEVDHDDRADCSNSRELRSRKRRWSTFGRRCRKKASRRAGGLRLGVQGGGCSGLSYNIRFDSTPRERDRIFEYGDVRVFIDPKSFVYLNGMTLEWEETLMHRGFVFQNPNAKKSCGCGSSFS